MKHHRPQHKFNEEYNNYVRVLASFMVLLHKESSYSNTISVKSEALLWTLRICLDV